VYISRLKFRADDFPSRKFYPFSLPCLQDSAELDLEARVVFFVGENGAGKSAVIEALVRRTGIHIWGGNRTHPVHRNPYEARLWEYADLTWREYKKYGFFFRAEAFFNFASSVDDLEMDAPTRLRFYGGRSFHQQSHGESFLQFFASYCFQLPGIYVMDEPEAALSPMSQVRFLRTLAAHDARGDSQFIIATHSPVLLSFPGARIISFDGGRLAEKAFDDLDHVRFYRRFMTDRQACLDEVLDGLEPAWPQDMFDPELIARFRPQE
jgi:predicted ATPase